MMASSSFQVEEKKKTKVKKNRRKFFKCREGRELNFFYHFCIWDEALFLPFPLHVPSTLNSPPSLSLVFHVSLKLCATQARELS